MRNHHPLAAQAVLLFAALFAFLPLQASSPEAVPGEYLVKLKSQFTKGDHKNLEKKLSAKIKSSIPKLKIIRIEKPLIQDQAAVINELKQNKLVEIAEPNYIYRINKAPNDPAYGKLWGLKNIGQSDTRGPGVAGIDIDAENAWDITTGSEDVLVAVIDTGVDENHPDLKENMFVNKAEANGEAGIDDDQNGYVDDVHGFNFVDTEAANGQATDDHGHGSHCAGTIGARGDDNKGIVGVNWKVKILSVKFLAADGGGTLEAAILAIDYATEMGAKIMSNSWGGGGESALLKEAIERSHKAGALFVAAAGNNSSNNDSYPHYPSNYPVPNVLSVAAIDNLGQLASFSNFGKRMVHVAAPGVNIFSSVTGGGYEAWSGTSMATPHVSGVAALLVANEPELSNLELKQRITATVKPISTMRGKVSSGGIANAFFALTNQVAPPDMNDPIHWQSQPLAISTAHPYGKKANEVFEVEVPGAKEIALYFEKFETEKGYDKVSLVDRNGNILAALSGSLDDSFSPTIAGDYVKVIFTSDDSVEKYGFDLTKVAYR